MSEESFTLTLGRVELNMLWNLVCRGLNEIKEFESLGHITDTDFVKKMSDVALRVKDVYAGSRYEYED